MGNMIRQNFKNKPFSSKSILQQGFRNTFAAPPAPSTPKVDTTKLANILKKK